MTVKIKQEIIQQCIHIVCINIFDYKKMLLIDVSNSKKMFLIVQFLEIV